MKVELEKIATVLKEYELYCYRIAFYLLEKEEFAITATKQTLLELGRNQRFLSDTAEKRRAWAKRTAIKSSLKVRKT